nr:PREDICTED: uncharacterized protein LOC109032783 [Bemisia tabaci]
MRINLNAEDEKTRTINSLLLLPILLPSIPVNKKWKPSRIESKDAFLLATENAQEAARKLTLRRLHIKKFGFPEQPTAVVSGINQDINVCIGHIIYTCDTALAAVDICCKLLIMLKAPLPPDVLLPVLFIKSFLYEVEPEDALQYPCLTTLKHELMHH